MPVFAMILGASLAFAAIATADDFPETLPGTKPADWAAGESFADRLVGQANVFLKARLRSRPDAGPPETRRGRFAKRLGVRDPRVPFDDFERVATIAKSSLIGRGAHYEIHAVRWPSVDGVSGEGLLLIPTQGEPRASVIALPDADESPEQLVGLTPGVPPESQFARRLAESGCLVLVPSLIDRTVAPRNGRARMTHREYLYRPSFVLGRHIIGYELQKVLAAADRFARDPGRPIGVFGWGEGGRLALDAGAIDDRFAAVGVSGAFGQDEGVADQPIDRNVFGLLDGFGDDQLASMIAPRALIIEETPGPRFEFPVGQGGAPGKLTDAIIPAEAVLKRSTTPVPATIVASPSPGSETALTAFLIALDPKSRLAPSGKAPTPTAPLPDRAARMNRQVAEIDRHTQRLLVESPYVRQEFWKDLDTSSLDRFRETVETYRDHFRDEVIGRLDITPAPPNPRTRRVYDEPRFAGYEVALDVGDGIEAYGILLIPKEIPAGSRRPVVVCQHGLEGRPTDVADPKLDHPAYHRFAVQLAERGFVTFAPQNLYTGEDRFRYLQRLANPQGKTLFSIMVPQHQVITDWLKDLPMADPNRIAFYGLSYGGKSAMRLPALVKNYCLSICSADFNDWVWKNASTRSPYSYVWTNEYEIFEWDLGSSFNYAEMAALIAPRPFMVERGHFDGVAPDETVASEFAKVRMLHVGRLKLSAGSCRIEFFDGPHTIHGVGSFEFLRQHLQFPEVPR